MLSYINWPTQELSEQDLYKDLNTALTFQSFKEYCSLFVLQSTQESLFVKKSANVDIENVNYKVIT